MSASRGALTRQVIDEAERRAPKRLGPYRRSLRWSLGQLWTGNRDLHYEVWHRARLGVVEVGLHFEADPLTNARLLGAFRSREDELRASLGEEPLLEEWDKGWTRIYESHPLREADLVQRWAERLADYIRVLEPILREELPADVAWRLPRVRETSRKARG